MNNIVFSRVDHRLIHGQVITKWLKIAQASKIIIIDDYLGQDAFMLDIYKMAAPSGVEVDILTAEQAGEIYRGEGFGERKTMILFKNITMVRKAVDSGLKIDSLQLGGLPHESDKKVIISAVSINQDDMNNLEFLNNQPVEITAQVVPEESSINFESISKKFNN